MRGWLTAVACVCLTLVLGASASAGVIVGVNDDAGKLDGNAAWFYPTVATTGLEMNAITLRWDETAPTVIPADAVVAAAIAKAKASGVDVELDVYPLHSQALTN